MAHWFSERIEQLCKELGMTPTRLGLAAGLSSYTIRKWKKNAEAGQFNPGREEIEKLASYTGKPVSWFVIEGSSRKTDPSGASTLIDADEAAKELTRLDGVSDDEAWLLMRHLLNSAPRALYFEARNILISKAMQKRHAKRVKKLKRSIPPLG